VKVSFSNNAKRFALARKPGDRAAAAEAAPGVDAQGRPHDRWWQMSTFDLMHGLEVSEAPMDTLPGDLVDDFLSIDLTRLRTSVRTGR